ncbi:hypothetical protein SpCBS45565_g05604 [Spizellomyces sp. 'palustris']|nr:hypothetical protein SpCBS45565_g05604 [Spizellomyces sp. 'palustris']
MNRKASTGAGGGSGGRPRGGGTRKDFHGSREFADVHHGGSQQGGKSKWGPPSGQMGHVQASRDRPLPKDNTVSESSAEIQHARLLFILANMIGTKVEVKVRNGTVYEGIYSASPTSKDLGVLLKMATKKTSDGSEGVTIKNLIIMPKDVCSISARPLDLSITQKASGEREVQTDTTISGHSGLVKERQLQKWAPDTGADAAIGLEDEVSHAVEWDQFATNEKLFGVTTDFDEHLYTTTVDKSDPNFKRREAEAIRLAREIERGPVNNPHIAEERGLDISSANVDEEERYSSVIRQPGKYIPPGARKAAASTGKAEQPKEGKRNEASSSVPIRETSSAKDVKRREPAAKEISTIPSKISQQNANKNAGKQQQKEAILSESTEQRQSPLRKHGASAAALTKLAQKKGAGNADLPEVPPNPVEAAHIAKLFKDFAVGEKEMLMQRKQVLMKQEKDQIVEEFKTFSKSFKLKTPMPEDLQEILHMSGDKESPKLPQARLETSKENTDSRPSKMENKAVTTKDDATRTQPSGRGVSPASAETERGSALKAASEEGKDNVAPTKLESGSDASPPPATAKSEFKFNVAALEFTPSSAPATATPVTQHKSPQHGEKSPYFGGKRTGKNQGSYQGKQQYGKGFQKNNGSPKPGHYVPQYGEEMYPQGVEPQQYFPYPVPPYQYRPMIGRPFVPGMPGMSMPPGATFIMPVPQGQFPPGFVAHPTQHAPVYPPQFVPPNANMRMYQKGQPGNFVGEENGGHFRPDGYQSRPVASSPVPAAFMGSPPPIYQPAPMMPGYPPEMMPHFQQPMMIPGPPHGQVWAPEQIPPEIPTPEPEQPTATDA